jgi:hypothetical protein
MITQLFLSNIWSHHIRSGPSMSAHKNNSRQFFTVHKGKLCSVCVARAIAIHYIILRWQSKRRKSNLSTLFLGNRQSALTIEFCWNSKIKVKINKNFLFFPNAANKWLIQFFLILTIFFIINTFQCKLVPAMPQPVAGSSWVISRSSVPSHSSKLCCKISS